MVITRKRHWVSCFAVTIFSAFPVLGDVKIPRWSRVEHRRSNTQITVSKRLTIVAVVNKHPENATLTLKWSLKNISKVNIRLIESNVLRDYGILVIDEYGKPVRLTPKGERASQASFFSSRRLVLLRPGQELKREIDLASLYNLKPRNLYIISLERRTATKDPGVIEEVRSIPIKVRL